MELTIVGQCSECTGDVEVDLWGFNDRSNKVILSVRLCETCLDKAKDKADEEGYERGIAEVAP